MLLRRILIVGCFHSLAFFEKYAAGVLYRTFNSDLRDVYKRQAEHLTITDDTENGAYKGGQPC